MDGEGRSAAGGVGDLAVAAVSFGDRVHDRQPQARSADGAVYVRAVETVEDARPRVRRDARAVVAHPELRAVGADGAADLDRTALGGVFRGVVGQLQPGLQQTVVVAGRGAR